MIRNPRIPNMRAQLDAQLAPTIVSLLKRAGSLATRQGVDVFVVGGFVRDLFLRRPIRDLDLVVEGDGIAYAHALAREVAGHTVVHGRFGTAVVTLPDSRRIDIATARREAYAQPAALPAVEPSSIKDDLHRRDFTINTLAICLTPRRFGVVIDNDGGRRDLKHGTVRVLHRKSFVDDPTRLLRAVRFEQRFGFHMDAETQALAKEAAQTDLLHRLSGSRLRAEVVRLLSEPAPRKSLVRLRRLGLLQFLHPTLQGMTRIDLKLRPVERALKWYRRQWPDRPLEVWLLYWMALMDLLPTDAMERLLARLSFPKHEASAIRAAHAELGAVLRRLRRHPSPSPAVLYRLLHGLPEETLLMMIVKTESNSVKRQLLAYMTTYRYIKPTLTGIDLQTLGVKPGPVFAILFSRLLEGRLNGSLTSVDDERALVRRVVRAFTSRASR